MNVFELFGNITIKGIDKANKQVTGLQGKVQGMSQQLKKAGIAATIAGGAIVAAFGLAVKTAADFESGMREVNSMMGLGQEEFEALSEQVRQLSADIGVDAVESTKALYQAISAGVPKENVLEFLEIATKAAIAGVTSTETAVDGLTTVINAFKLPISDAQKVADIMFTTVKGGKTTFDELSASLFQVAPIAAASGVQFEEVAAALATMTKQGVPTSVATTQLRQAMVALQKPTAEMGKVIESLGYESGQAMLAELGLASTLNTLRDATAGSNEMLMGMFGSVEAGAAVLALTGENARTFAADMDAMAKATEGAGAATEAFAIIDEGASRQIEKLKAQVQALAISIGNQLIPILKPLVEKISAVVKKVGDWMKEHPGLTRIIILGTAAIGALLLVLGPLLIMLPGLVTALPMVGAAFTAMLGPVGLIIAGIAALIAIGVLVWKNWDTIKKKAKAIWDGICNFFKSIWKGITDIFKKHWDKILAILFPAVGIPILIARNWEKVKEFTKKIWNSIVDFFKAIPEKIVGFFKSIPEKFGEIFSKLKDIVLAPFRAIWSGIEKGINWVIKMLNKISFTVPDWVPFIGGKHFGMDISEVTLPKFAGGGLIPEPTLLYGLKSQRPYAIAGEAGEEVISPAGAGGVTNYFQGPWFIREEADIYKLARELKELQDRTDRRIGVRSG